MSGGAAIGCTGGEDNGVIPLAQPLITEEDKVLVVETLGSCRLAAGERVRAFEAAFAAYVGARHAVMTSSGTAALLAAVAALGIGPGDKVITTPFTFIATVTAILHAGAVPVFADIDPVTYNLDPDGVARAMAVHPDAAAILVVHLYGLPAAMPEIARLARTHGLMLIEDCAQAPGAAVDGRAVGTFGDAACFSFYATKNMTTGEGGAVVTSDPEVAERVRRFIDHGQSERYRHDSLGFNLRMTELQAALGLGQLRRLDERNARRQAHARFYDAAIVNPHVTKPLAPPGLRHVYHHYTLRVRDREGFLWHMAAQGVCCGVHYPRTVPQQPLFRRVRWEGLPQPEAEAAAAAVVSIPVHPALSQGDLERVAEAVNAFQPRV